MKKLLLVAVSVGIFLLITITVALIVISPKSTNQEPAFSSSVPYSFTKPVPSIMSDIPEQPETGDTLVTHTGEDERPVAVITSDRIEGDRLTIHAPVSSSTAVIAEISPTPTSTQVKITPAISQTSTTQASSSAARQPAQTAAPATRATSQPAAARTTTTSTSRAGNDYWIQTGAFSAMVRAEDAREVLANNGLVSIIENRVVNGSTFYRVRLGPYTSEREANHWLAIVKSIDGFGESQVRQTVRQQ